MTTIHSDAAADGVDVLQLSIYLDFCPTPRSGMAVAEPRPIAPTPA